MKAVRTDRELECPRVDAGLRGRGVELVTLPHSMTEAELAREVADADLLLMCYTPVTPQVIAYMQGTYKQAVAKFPKLANDPNLGCWYLGPDGDGKGATVTVAEVGAPEGSGCIATDLSTRLLVKGAKAVGRGRIVFTTCEPRAERTPAIVETNTPHSSSAARTPSTAKRQLLPLLTMRPAVGWWKCVPSTAMGRSA